MAVKRYSVLILTCFLCVLLGWPGCNRKSANKRKVDVTSAGVPDDLSASSDLSQKGTPLREAQKVASVEDHPKRLESQRPNLVQATDAASNDAASIDAADMDDAIPAPDSSHTTGSDDANADLWADAGAWTTKRLIMLARNGPVIIDLMFQVDQQDLVSAAQASASPVCDELLKEMGDEATWEKLQGHPLILSGWLGNLRTSDSSTQQGIATFDQNKDGIVQPEELEMLVSQGLGKFDPIRLNDLGAQSSTAFSSPWGPLDQDEDHVLTTEELKSAARRLLALDIDGDLGISLAELNPAGSTSGMTAQQAPRSMLPIQTIIFESDSEGNVDTSRMLKQRQRKTTELMQHYTYLNSLQRELWPNWSDHQWKLVDTSGDGQIDARELQAIFDVAPQIRVAVRIPGLSQSQAIQWQFDSRMDSTSVRWESREALARLSSSDFDLRFSIQDLFGRSTQEVIKAQLAASLRNPQLKTFIAMQLQLSENAFELLDSDGDQNLSDEEFDRVWSWMVCRQMARFNVQWSSPPHPWFQLLDQDMDQRISEWEISQAESVIERFDLDGDGSISAEDLPLVASLLIRRSDDRFPLPGSLTSDAEGSASTLLDWFAAMDTNNDGVVSRAEFLGNRSQFQGLDEDGDGFLSRSEMPR